MRKLRSLSRGKKILTAVVALVLIMPAVGYGFLALQSTGAPAPASLGEAPENLTADDGDDSFPGKWTLAEETGSFVGYRVRERLGLVPAPNDAVGRTSDVEASMTIDGTRLTAAEVTADLRTLKSDAEPRDGILHDQGLESELYPEGTFRLTEPVELGTHAAGEAFSFFAVGDLTLHGITRKVRSRLQARWNGGSFQLAGQLEIKRSDYKLEIDQQMGLRISEDGKIEFELTFTRPGDGSAGTKTGTSTATTPDENPSKPGPLEPPAEGDQLLALAFAQGATGAEDAQTSIYAARVDGSGLRRLTNETMAFDQDPAWSPDASKIVFTRIPNYEGGPPPSIYVMNADGSREGKVSRGRFGDTSPAWSPDGTQLAFVRGNDRGSSIWVMRADGSDAQRVSGDKSTPDDSPAWSPDGTRIAYVSFVPGGNEDIFVMNADGTGVKRVTRTPAYDYAPSWAPDGEHIAFARDGDVFTMRPDGTRLRRLTRGRVEDATPRWSNDGRQVAFTRIEAQGTFGGPSRIVVVNADGSNARRVPIRGQASYPSWQPGG